ncbi:MAG TPA: 3-hydroxyacyl-CoA dehydrogenase NAD-binding domain-containing protein [Anaeromyxobacteraceae bacterium]|nr:3-hydroxyacyl-CoA dehydrogenase NAD-binding domain-containing protein [Anaeromyxobacteraceae bacterium]
MLGIRTIALLGTNRDAVGLALLSALAGLDVRVHHASPDALDAGFRALREDVERAVADGRLDREARQRIFDGILFTPVLDEAVVGADLVFAAGDADAGPARARLAEAARSCRATALLATPLDPPEVSDAVPQPGRVVGLRLSAGADPFPHVALRAGPGTTAHARERATLLVERLDQAAGRR